VHPAVGEVRITEWMANPAAVDNRAGEWVELRFDEPADLNALSLSDLTERVTTIESRDCLPVAAGAYVVLARSTDPATNGGVENTASTLSLSLNNTDETLSLSVDGVLLDSVSWERTNPGVATQVDALGRVCEAMDAYGDGDLGTPGFANPVCA